MDFQKLEDFYRVYDQHRTYVRAEVRPKHLRNFDEQFWRPARVSAGHSVLELGSGVGLFLAYLVTKGVTDFTGVEQDEMVLAYPVNAHDRYMYGAATLPSKARHRLEQRCRPRCRAMSGRR